MISYNAQGSGDGQNMWKCAQVLEEPQYIFTLTTNQLSNLPAGANI
jgi:hypothetical protein